MTPSYPKPDRSNFRPNFKKTEENDALDIAWGEGLLSDGRPYRMELWCQDQVTCLTIFVSQIGLGAPDEKDVEALLEREALLQFSSPKRYASAIPYRDSSGNELLSINVVVGDDHTTFVTGGPSLHPYAEADS